jgi:hypothetical protein
MVRAIQATWIIAVIFVLGFACAFYFMTAPYRELNAWGRSVISQLEVAKSKPPRDVGGAQWECILGWTQNAFPNVFYSPESIVNPSKFMEFKKELKSRLSENVDVATITWIWNQVALLSTNGADYGRKFRPVPPYGEIHLSESNEPFDNVRISNNAIGD